MDVLLKLVVACALVVLVVAYTEKPCCISKKWHGKMKIVTATLAPGSMTPVITENHLEFDYDFDMKMERASGHITTYNGSVELSTNYTVYNDYRHGRKYVMTSYVAGCHVEMMDVGDEQTPPCVPKELKWSGNYSVGSTGARVAVNEWIGDSGNFHYSMLTTVDNCSPVEMSRFGSNPDGTMVNEETVYVDVVQYETHPDIFRLPDICQQAGMAVGK